MLIEEYARLERLEGHTPQSRGQRFNGVIAELLECWGLEARASARSKGEIDVGFTHEGVRYVLEAKWERTKADFGDLAKLRSRVHQRLSGTHGIFLAMAGYTPEALAGVSDGQRLELLLLDRSHWEAMLSGLVPPQELLTLARDHAAFRGGAFAPLATLLERSAKPPRIEFDKGVWSEPLLESAAQGCGAQGALSVASSDQLGITCIGADELLLTTSSGIVRANLATRTSAAAVEVAHCHRNAALLPDGSILFARRLGVGRFHDGRISSVAGGAVGATCLVEGPDGSTWLLDNGEPSGQTTASISRIGNHLVEQVRYDIAYPSSAATNAAWLAPDQLLVIGASGFQTTALIGGSSPLEPLSQANPMGLVQMPDRVVLTAGDGVTILATHLATSASVELAQVALRGSVSELAQSSTGEIYLAAYDRSPHPQTYTVVRLDLAVPTTFPPRTPATASTKATTAAALASAPTPPAAPPEAGDPRSAERSQPGATWSAFDRAAAALAAERQREHENGYRDGVAFAPSLGWLRLAGLAERNFDLKGWLEGWRNGWFDVQMGRAPAGVEAASWLPALADLLGSYVDPIGHDGWSFTPSTAYVDGLIDGLRAIWTNSASDSMGADPARPSPSGPSPSPGTHASAESHGPIPETHHNHRPAVALPPAAQGTTRPANGDVPNATRTPEFVTVKGILGSINFDGEAVTIRKEGFGSRMKGVQTLPLSKIQKVIVKPATAMFHGYIQFVVRDHPPAPDLRYSTAGGRPHREDPDSMSYPRRANDEIQDLKQRIDTAIALTKS